MDLISIIVPVYKVEKYLRRCVDSIINQTYKNLEIILVDDGSPDNCPAICDEYAKKDNRIKVIHKENGGVSSARNEGLKNATGDFICFVDSDDYVDNNYVEKLLNGFSDDVDIVISMYRVIDNESRETKTHRFVDEVKTVFIDENFDFRIMNCNCSVWGKLFKKDLLSNQLFSEKIHFGEDALFVAEMITKSKAIRHIPDYTYNYIVYDNSLSHGEINEKKLTLYEAWYRISMLFAEGTVSRETCSQVYLTSLFYQYGLYVSKEGSGSEVCNKLYEVLCSKKTVDCINSVSNNKKTKIKYNFLVHFRKLYDMILLLKEPFVKHYDEQNK